MPNMASGKGKVALFLLVAMLPIYVDSAVDANHDFFEGFSAPDSTQSPETSNSTGREAKPVVPRTESKGGKSQCESQEKRLVILPGPHGPPGSPGPRGMPGPPGIPGYSGMNGHNGEPGLCTCMKGPKGHSGPMGREGATGVQGPRGSPGSAGDTGLPGPTGEKGDPGNCTGAGAKGDTGPPGPPGKRGASGENGEPGEPGADAVCDAQLCRDSAVRSAPSDTDQSGGGTRDRKRNFSAFSVSRFGTAEALDDTEIITWDHEFSNVGGDFSSETGIFNCSIAGEVQVSIIDADYWDSEDSSSNSVILELSVGDIIWLDLYEGRVLHSSYYRYTTFSGTLLHAR
ncbi:putative collagen alpha-1(X) chain [Apostichopus japonicus]|uniref:Putative collagen alpha-1(X) chain n=1 Tax=Stichopus japonicus TaxID=307972 RepID=A0A2G8KSE3_STIJA|nr:putative collagen alpha-1(X) chain [Apostichopus japonicus]